MTKLIIHTPAHLGFPDGLDTPALRPAEKLIDFDDLINMSFLYSIRQVALRDPYDSTM
jgi:hypothetical protein